MSRKEDNDLGALLEILSRPMRTSAYSKKTQDVGPILSKTGKASVTTQRTSTSTTEQSALGWTLADLLCRPTVERNATHLAGTPGQIWLPTPVPRLDTHLLAGGR